MNLTPGTRSSPDTETTPRLVAVIDIGASSVRMQISELHGGHVRHLDSLTQAVSIGRDSFSKGSISRTTMEDCVHVLKIYRSKLDELQIPMSHVRVVATSGVREASNRLEFQDRVYIATGLEIDSFDEAELHRVTYLGIQPYFSANPDVFVNDTVVAEIGGGTTEVLFLRDTDVLFARTFRLGALRMLLALESLATGADQNRAFLEAHILQYIQQIQHLVHDETASYVAMGSDIRFAAKELGLTVQPGQLTEIPMTDLRRFVDRVFSKPADRLAIQYRMSIAEAHALGPALLAHLLLARRFNTDRIYVAQVNLRDGLLLEMAHGRVWLESIQRQIVRSAQACGKKYDYDERHAEHVALLACMLFDQLRTLHGLDHRFQALLHMAGLLHEIGLYVSGRSYHKHSMYLIQNTEFFGIGQRDLQLIGLIARYHRRATPQPSHEGYDSLDRDSRIAVAKLAAILRVAVALDALRSQRITHVLCISEANRVRLQAHGSGDLTAEQLELRQSGQMFEQLFGVRLILESGDEV